MLQTIWKLAQNPVNYRYTGIYQKSELSDLLIDHKPSYKSVDSPLTIDTKYHIPRLLELYHVARISFSDVSASVAHPGSLCQPRLQLHGVRYWGAGGWFLWMRSVYPVDMTLMWLLHISDMNWLQLGCMVQLMFIDHMVGWSKIGWIWIHITLIWLIGIPWLDTHLIGLSL